MAIVTLAISGLKSALKRPRSVLATDRHIFGSSTLRRIHSVKSAGRTPPKNTPRQPQRLLASHAIRNHTEDDPARGGRQQRDRAEDTRHAKREMQGRVLNERREDDRVQHHVERIEHPAERRSDERVLRPLVGSSPP